MRHIFATPRRCFWLGAGLLGLVVCAAYSSVLFAHYAYADDFMTLYAVHSKDLSDKIAPFHNVQGRPLGGWIMETVFRAAWTIHGLDRVRAGCLGLTLLWGAILAAEFRRVAPWWLALEAVSLLLLNPATAVAVAWPSNGLLSLPSAILALLGGVGWRRALDGSGLLFLNFWLQITGGCGLLLAALLVYQPCACFFLLPAAIRLLDKNEGHTALQAGWWTAGGFMCTSAGYFAAFQLIRPHLAKAEEIVMYRADVVQDVMGRLRFYLGDVLPRSFGSWAVFFGVVPSALVSGAAGLLTLLLLVRLVHTQGGTLRRWQALLVAPILFGFASSPLLVVKDNYAPFRTLAVLYSLVVVGCVGGLAEIMAWTTTRRQMVRAVPIVLWTVLVAANVAIGTSITKEALVKRSVHELDLYRAFAKLQLAEHPKELIILLPDRADIPQLTKIIPQHEFGTASSNDDFNFPGLVYFALKEEDHHGLTTAGGGSFEIQILMYRDCNGRSGLFPPDVAVMDTVEALRGRQYGDAAPRSGPVIDDPFFGEIQRLTPTWQLSRWFGLYQAVSPHSVIHRELGPLELGGSGGNDCWFYRVGSGWLWTNPTSFPSIYSCERARWLWYIYGTKSPAECYDLNDPSKPSVPRRL